MNVALWIAAGLLAAVYLGSGLLKAVQSREKLLANPNFGWMHDVSGPAVRAVGVIEVLGAIGLILPWLTGIATILTPLAAVGLVIVMIVAIVLHVRRGEMKPLPVNVVLLLLAAFVAIGRF